MKKTLLLMAVAILVVATMALSFADASFSPASIFGKLIGVTEEEAYQMRLDTGKTFGQLAEEKGVYDEFLTATKEAKIAYVNQLVAEGKLTQAEADQIINNINLCDGTQQGLNKGIFGRGMMNGTGLGRGMMNGTGFGAGAGACHGTGTRLQDGTGANVQGSGFGGGRGMMRGFSF